MAMTKLVFICLSSVLLLCNATVTTEDGTTFESGTMPFYRFDTPRFNVSAHLTTLDAYPDVRGKIVAVPFELHVDSTSYHLESAGAVGVIILTTQYPPGWTFNKFEWKYTVSIPQVDVYYTDFENLLTVYGGRTVTITDSPNLWQATFNRQFVLSMTLIGGGLFGALTLLSGWAFVDSVPRARRQRKDRMKKVFSTFRTVNYGLSFLQCSLLFVRYIDLNGTSGILGYAAANMLSYLPVQINYANVFLYVVYLIEIVYLENVTITGFVQNKMLYVALSVICGAAGIVSISLTVFVQGTLAMAIYATTSSGAIRISSGLLFIVASSLLIRKMNASRNQKKQRGEPTKPISGIVYSLVVLGVAILLHGVLIVSILAYFNSPTGNAIFYWLEGLLDAIIMTILVLPFIKTTVLQMEDPIKSSSTEKVSMERSV